MRAIEPQKHARTRHSTRLSWKVVVSLYHTYFECAPGADAAVARSCPPGTLFAASNGTCIHVALLHDRTVKPVPGCTDVSCFCTGRANGMYAQPNNASSGVICGGGQPSPFSCPAGFPFTPGYGCAQMGAAGQSPSPQRP